MGASSLISFCMFSLAFGFPHSSNLGLKGLSHHSKEARQGSTILEGTTLKSNHLTWSAPGENDLRSPCPALNTLANHGFLPHDGRNITLAMLKTAAKDGLNVGPLVPEQGFGRAILLNPDPNATFIDLSMLHKHNHIEHDSSFSRRDTFFDPTNPFDAATFDSFLSYFGNEQNITVAAAENARARHALDMSKLNPEFGLTKAQVGVIQGEIATMLAVFGHPEFPHINRPWFEFFIRNERLPVDLGWTPRSVETDRNVLLIAAAMQAASPTDIPLVFE
ncbi:Chloroperoxidase [Pyrenochaeta sp. MPI-SDFR-AT-0127]|nr:Chloroperoxidase [Pyrenochaeta sp. MPI-SDFR-AT-0127]